MSSNPDKCVIGCVCIAQQLQGFISGTFRNRFSGLTKQSVLEHFRVSAFFGASHRMNKVHEGLCSFST